jgi:acyl carrier protein
VTALSREAILGEVQRLMADLFELDPGTVTEASRLGEDLDLDSIDAIDLIIKMQEMTGQKVDPKTLAGVRTVGDVIDLVERLLARRP